MSSETRVSEEDNVEFLDAESAREQAEEAEGLLETDIRQLLEQVRTLTDERDQLKDQVLRAMADFQNYKRRNQQELISYRQFATQSFVTDLLPVLDNFERSIDHLEAGATVSKVIEGIHAVERQLRQVLEGQNVRRVESVGQPFDPTYHEALGTEMSFDHPDGVVSTEIEPGYRMGEKVIRPAKVKISKRSG
jgi:molecular chaperone GrpE